MTVMTMKCAIAPTEGLALLLIGAGPIGAAPLSETNVNRGVVELETMGANRASARTDLANVIDNGATRWVLPILDNRCIIDLKAVHDRWRRHRGGRGEGGAGDDLTASAAPDQSCRIQVAEP
jgi:hypothetical protein